MTLSNYCILVPCVIGFLLIVLIPYIHIGIFHRMLWVPNKVPVNRKDCTCSCWDTVFKGSYENGIRVGYKHMYFNSTAQMFAIWTVTIAAVLLFYETVKYLWRLHVDKSLRISMLILLLMDIHPHYYSWWSYFNYFNDDFYSQFVHQTFFTMTELISTAIIVYMCSKQTPITPSLLIGVLSINIVHILIGGIDQFVKQLIFMDGKLFQRTRNLGFLIPDILHVVIPIYEYKRSDSQSCETLFTRKQWIMLASISMFLFLLGKSI